jgi:hypothetical protein
MRHERSSLGGFLLGRVFTLEPQGDPSEPMTSYLTWRRNVLLSSLDRVLQSASPQPAAEVCPEEVVLAAEPVQVFEQLEQELARCLPRTEIAATTTDLLTSRRSACSAARLRFLDAFRRHLQLHHS